MADIKSREERSKNMSAVKSKDTQPEIYIRKLLYSRGYRYRKNTPDIVGCPDIYLAKKKVAIFIHGCFWHHHSGCKYAYSPKTRPDYWNHKFERNILRDIEVTNLLNNAGVRQLVIWECTIRSARNNNRVESSLLWEIDTFLNSDIQYAEI